MDSPEKEQEKKERETPLAEAFQDECEICGYGMYGLHCKIICPNCGYRRDCSDP